MKTSDLVFVGIGRSVVALNGSTGEQVWATRLKGYDFVNVVLDGGRILATSCGEIFCLDPLTGHLLWHNRLKGFGTGLATIAIVQGARGGSMTVLAEKQRQGQAAAAGAMVPVAAA
jgi:outer membrane protein assembly factor BamB